MGRVDQSDCVQMKVHLAHQWPIFGLMSLRLMAEIGHYFLRPLKNSAIYFRIFSDFRPTVIQSFVQSYTFGLQYFILAYEVNFARQKNMAENKGPNFYKAEKNYGRFLP